MSLPLEYHASVTDDIDAAFAWYEEQREGLGDDFLARLRELLDSIQENPYLYGVIHGDVRSACLRRFPYVVYYRPEAERTVILAVLHGRRHPRRWQSRM